MSTSAERRPAWIWPIRLPAAFSTRLLKDADRLGDAIARRGTWAALAILFGAFPVALGYLLGLPGSDLVTATLLGPCLVAAAARDSLRLALGVIGLTFLTHSAITIGLAAADPAGLAHILPSGANYWRQSETWIVTGVNPEYELGAWLPAHVQLFAGATLLSYTSLGFVTLWEGLREVDMMNFYVGQLAVHSRRPWLAIALGWHPWSVCRGIGLALITFETASYSLARLTGARLSTAGRRVRRWAAGLALLVLDGVIKYTLLDAVRQILSDNML